MINSRIPMVVLMPTSLVNARASITVISMASKRHEMVFIRLRIGFSKYFAAFNVAGFG